MATEMYDFGVIDRIAKASSYSEFTDDEISMYIRYQVDAAKQEVLISEQTKLLKEQQEALRAEAELYRAQAKAIIAKIGGEESD